MTTKLIVPKMQLYTHLKMSGYFEAIERDGAFDVCPQGGGFLKKFSKSAFDALFVPVTVDFPLKKGTVTADFFSDDVFLPCYSTGLVWNGWGVPLFDRETAHRVVELLNMTEQLFDPKSQWSGDVILHRNCEFDKNSPSSESNEKYVRFQSEAHLINGVSTNLWRIGDGWTWDAVEFED